MKTTLRWLGVFLLFPFFLSAQEVMTLEKCREMALENNRQIRIAEQNKEKSSSMEKAYRANFLPKISASGAYLFTSSEMSKSIGGNYLPTFVPDPLTGQLTPNLFLDPSGNPVMIDGTPLFNQYSYFPGMDFDLSFNGTYFAGIKAEQPIYMGGKITSAYKMSKTGREIAKLNQHLTETEVILQTDEAYWTYVKTTELHKSAEKYKEVVTELYRVVENASKAGMKSQNDVMKVQVKLNEAELQVLQAANGVRLARMNLCHMIGFPLLNDIMLPVAYDETLLEIDPDAGITSRPEYAMLNRQIEIKQYEKQLTQSDFLPNIGVMGSYNYAYGLKLNDDPLLDKGSFSAVVSVNIPLFQWGEGINKVRAAETDKKIIELQRDDAAEKMQLELMKALNGYEEANLEVMLTTQSLKQSEENLKISRNHYDAGMETLADYLEAQTIWQKAASDLINAKASLKLSETYYLKAAGKLQPGEKE